MRTSEPLGAQLVVQRIIKVIKRALIEGELEPGDKLPTEKEFVEKFKVSRTSYREAIKMLIALGVVEIKRGDGTYIRKGSSDSMVDPLIFSLLLQKKTPDHLLQLRSVLEVGVIDILAQEATEKDIQKIEKAHQDFEESYRRGDSDTEQLCQHDLSFHYACVEATHNPLLVELIRVILDLLVPYVHKSHRLGGIERTLREHKAILEAIKERNFEKAKGKVRHSFDVWKKFGLSETL